MARCGERRKKMELIDCFDFLCGSHQIGDIPFRICFVNHRQNTEVDKQQVKQNISDLEKPKQNFVVAFVNLFDNHF